MTMGLGNSMLLHGYTNPILTMSGLQIYYDSRFVNGTNSSSPADATGISAWSCLKNNPVNQMIQNTPANQPIYHSNYLGLPAVEFTKVNSTKMSCPQNANLESSFATQFCVFSFKSLPIARAGIVLKYASANGSPFPYGFQVNGTATGAGSFTTTTNIVTQINFTNPGFNQIQMIQSTYNNVTVNDYNNNTNHNIAVSDGGIITSTGALTMGEGTTGLSRFFDGYLYMYAKFSRALSTAEINVIRAYISLVYGLSLNPN